MTPAPSRLVKPPRVAAAPCALECKLLQIVALDDLDGRPLDCHVVFGQVVGVHIDDRFIMDGRLDTAAHEADRALRLRRIRRGRKRVLDAAADRLSRSRPLPRHLTVM